MRLREISSTILFLQPRGANDRHFSSLPSVGSYVGERSRYTGCTRNDRQQDDACNTLRKTRFRGLAAAFLLPGQSKVPRRPLKVRFSKEVLLLKHPPDTFLNNLKYLTRPMTQAFWLVEMM